MKLLVVDNHDSFTFNLVQIIKQSRICEVEIIKNDLIILDTVKNYDKILFTPGPGLPSEFPIMRDIISSYKETKNIFGICLGHQAIAEYFGASLYNKQNVEHGVSKKIDVIKSDVLFKSVPNQFDAGIYHSWYVSKNNFPDCLEVTSISEDQIIMSLSHKKFDIRGVQFHPESIMTKFGRQILINWLAS